MKKETLIKQYNLSKKQISLIELYLESLKKTNHHLNLVGSSTLKNPWDRHINDSLQLSKFIPDKKEVFFKVILLSEEDINNLFYHKCAKINY